MRNGQNKRMRGRNRKGQNPLTRVYESNGPDVKVRGTASHIADKYVQLARDAQSSGDPVAAENYYQHAEHYFRLIAAVQEQFRQTQPFFRENDSRDGGYDDGEDDSPEAGMGGENYVQHEQPQPYPPREQPYPPREHQHREQRYGRDRDRGDRPDRGERGDRNHQQHFQPRPQPPQQPQPELQAAEDDNGIDRLPAFLTGGAPQPAVQANHGPNGQNGFEGAPDRFPLHRRRRRRHGGRENAGGDASEGSPRSGDD